MVGRKRHDPPIEAEEGDFPRGGREDLTPLEKRQLSQQAEADFKQEQTSDAPGKNQRKRSKHSKDKVRCSPQPANATVLTVAGRSHQRGARVQAQQQPYMQLIVVFLLAYLHRHWPEGLKCSTAT